MAEKPPVSTAPLTIEVGDQIWWSMTGVYATDAQKAVTQTTTILLILSVVALLLVIFTTVFLLRRMLKPIGTIVAAADEIVAGNLDIHLEIKSEDEVGMLAHAFRTMSRNLQAIILDIDNVLSEMANGNFRVHTQTEDRYVGAYQSLLQSIRRINASLSSTLSEINVAADQVSGGADQVAAGSQALSQGSTEQASSVQELAATITEISSQVSENAGRAMSAKDKAVAVSGKVTEGNQQMQETLAAMGDIRSSSDEISKIIKTIEDIAFQTNILSLNAAVEAARAGSAGKGFAVVADEVRNLAGKSAEAAKTTTALIQQALASVEHGTKSLDTTAQTLNVVVGSVNEITEEVQQIADASEAQASAIEQVTLGIDQISSVVQTNSATAEESAAASEELSSQATMLKALVGKFKLKDTDTVYQEQKQEQENPSDESEPVTQPVVGGYANIFKEKY